MCFLLVCSIIGGLSWISTGSQCWRPPPIQVRCVGLLRRFPTSLKIQLAMSRGLHLHRWSLLSQLNTRLEAPHVDETWEAGIHPTAASSQNSQASWELCVCAKPCCPSLMSCTLRRALSFLLTLVVWPASAVRMAAAPKLCAYQELLDAKVTNVQGGVKVQLCSKEVILKTTEVQGDSWGSLSWWDSSHHGKKLGKEELHTLDNYLGDYHYSRPMGQRCCLTILRALVKTCRKRPRLKSSSRSSSSRSPWPTL